MNDPRESPDYGWDDDRPLLNDLPPTPFELASLASIFLAAGKSENESFELARSAFARAEVEVLEIKSLRERRQDEMYMYLPDEAADREAKCLPMLKKLALPLPDVCDFPTSTRDFYDAILPQLTKIDRERCFSRHILPAVRDAPIQGKHANQIPDLDTWFQLLERTWEVRKWDDPKKLKNDLRALQSPNRRQSRTRQDARRRRRTKKMKKKFPL